MIKKPSFASPVPASTRLALRWSPELLISLFSLLISLSAVVFNSVQTSIMRSQQRASVWPYLELSRGIYGNVFYLDAYNKGVGPAIIKQVVFTYQGKQYGDFLPVARLIVADSTFTYANLETSPLSQRVLSAGEKIRVFQASHPDHAVKLLAAISEVNIQVIYASIYDQRWQATNQQVQSLE